MKDLALDVWADLREKRLWPVAAVLVLALIAVPTLLLNGEPDPPAPKSPATVAGNTSPVVNLDPEDIAGSSKLSAFKTKNPFRPLLDREELAAVAAEAGATGVDSGGEADTETGTGGGDPMGSAGGASAAGDTGGTPSGGGSSSPSAGTGSSSPPAGSGSDSGSKPPADGDSDSGGGETPVPTPAPEPQLYQYVVDVEFGRIGDERRDRDVRALDALPSEKRPVVVYLGQTRDNESAFLVNQAIGQRGEGNCVPNRSDCSIVYLRPQADQDDHYFETGPPDDFTYHLRLIAVRRSTDTRETAKSPATSSDARVRAEGAKSKRTVRRTPFDFRIPLIAGTRR